LALGISNLLEEGQEYERGELATRDWAAGYESHTVFGVVA
tara:strand:- start:377 stop:496 length:120 start_codon:yes stop_codon:yes gene_type:complete